MRFTNRVMAFGTTWKWVKVHEMNHRPQTHLHSWAPIITHKSIKKDYHTLLVCRSVVAHVLGFLGRYRECWNGIIHEQSCRPPRKGCPVIIKPHLIIFCLGVKLLRTLLLTHPYQWPSERCQPNPWGYHVLSRYQHATLSYVHIQNFMLQNLNEFPTFVHQGRNAPICACIIMSFCICDAVTAIVIGWVNSSRTNDPCPLTCISENSPACGERMRPITARMPNITRKYLEDKLFYAWVHSALSLRILVVHAQNMRWVCRCGFDLDAEWYKYLMH